ncbi:MAG TPA: hypothetical protein VK968_15245 [Roseimicrobium sp.]|nr:hypothetical protein [Roseimicrobium sp.]
MQRLAVLVIVLGSTISWRWLRWEPLPDDGGIKKWQRRNVLHIDSNKDGIVDEEITTGKAGTWPVVRRDTNADGYFDLQYKLGPNGIAFGMEKIRARAPRHR